MTRIFIVTAAILVALFVAAGRFPSHGGQARDAQISADRLVSCLLNRLNNPDVRGVASLETGGSTVDAVFPDQRDVHVRLAAEGADDAVDLWIYVVPNASLAMRRWATYAIADFGKLKMARVANVIYEHTGSLQKQRYSATLGCVQTLAGRRGRV